MAIFEENCHVERSAAKSKHLLNMSLRGATRRGNPQQKIQKIGPFWYFFNLFYAFFSSFFNFSHENNQYLAR